MNRPSRRTFSLVALVSLGGASILFGTLEQACAFTSSSSPTDSVCTAIAGYFQSCAVPSTCRAAFSRDCTKVTATISESAINALFTCAQNNETCGDAGTAMVSSCAVTGFENFIPTAAQHQLSTDYCRACAPQNAGCSSAFFTANGAAGSGPTSFSLAGDTTVQSADSACTPHLPTDAGTAACEAAFRACASPIATAGLYIPPECVGDVNAGTAPGDGG